MVQSLDDNLFRSLIFDYTIGGNAPLLIHNNTIIEFWVTWCPHCQAMAPRYEKVSDKFKNIDCYRVEMEQHPKLTELFGVTSFPTFIFINPQGDMKKWVGELVIDELTEMIHENFKI